MYGSSSVVEDIILEKIVEMDSFGDVERLRLGSPPRGDTNPSPGAATTVSKHAYCDPRLV